MLIDASRGDGSSLVHVVIDGLDVDGGSDTGMFLGEIERHGGFLEIEREVERRQDLSHALQAREIDGPDFRQLKGFLQDAGDQIGVPCGPVVRTDSQETRLRGAGFRLFVVERHGRDLRGARDAFRPLVHHQPGVRAGARGALGETCQRHAPLGRRICRVDRQRQPLISG